MDYGKKSPSLGWRFTDAWLSIAGAGDKGIPNGLPVDEWGIRVENKIPKGASVSRGGAVNGPAAVYALTKYVDWMKEYAPPYAASMTWSEAGPTPARGNIAQRVFQYITWLSDPAFNDPESPVTDENGTPLWRVAPTPHGKYWEEGMKVGYQDAGSWTILKDSVKGDDRAAAWLWAQFAVSKSVSLKKFLVGRTPVRKSTVFSDYLAEQEKAHKYGGIVTFYKSPVEYMWTDSGPNVPHYPLLAEQWWKNIATAVTGETTPQESMDNLARDMDDLMGKMNLKQFSPQLNEPRDPEYWLSQPGSPKAERPDEEPKTVPYDELLKQWTGK
jgi:glycerol transport system substrate-binding protein